MDASDQHLLSDFLAGKEQAFRQLSERHMNLVYGVALRGTSDPTVAEEVVQDVFLLLARKARKLAAHPCVAGWLHKASRNVARDARRKRLGHEKKLQRFAEEATASSQMRPTDDTQHAEIDSAVSALPDREREAILLRFFEDQDYREIADQLAISEAAARKRVSRGIQRLHSGLQTKLAAGTALAILAPGHLPEAVANSVAAVAPTASAATASTAVTSTIIMTKSAVTIACAVAAISVLGGLAIQQSSKRKVLATELASAESELVKLRQQAERETLSGIDRNATVQNRETRIAELETQLREEKSKRKLAEADAEAVREATADLEDQVVVAFGKVGEIGTDFGSVFKEAMALSKIEAAGELESDENEMRLVRFFQKAASISGLTQQIIEFENDPIEGGEFFSSTYQAIFDLDATTTKALQTVFSDQIGIAKEQGLTLANNPGLKMLSGEDDSITEADVKEWLTRRQEFYGEFRQKLRDKVPANKVGEFDEYVEQDGIGFTNLKLKGSPLAFSLGGRQD